MAEIKTKKTVIHMMKLLNTSLTEEEMTVPMNSSTSPCSQSPLLSAKAFGIKDKNLMIPNLFFSCL